MPQKHGTGDRARNGPNRADNPGSASGPAACFVIQPPERKAAGSAGVGAGAGAPAHGNFGGGSGGGPGGGPGSGEGGFLQRATSFSRRRDRPGRTRVSEAVARWQERAQESDAARLTAEVISAPAPSGVLATTAVTLEFDELNQPRVSSVAAPHPPTAAEPALRAVVSSVVSAEGGVDAISPVIGQVPSAPSQCEVEDRPASAGPATWQPPVDMSALAQQALRRLEAGDSECDEGQSSRGHIAE